MDLPHPFQLKDGTPVALAPMQPAEGETVRDLLNAVILEGNSYPQREPLTPDGFADYWLKADAFVVRRLAPTPATPQSEIVGAFYLKPNFPGRCSHICNAGFIVPPEVRGQGIGRFMGEAMLNLARDRGYRAVMYNLIFDTNLASLALWRSLGFQEIGRIPQAVALPGGAFVDAIMLYKSLAEESSRDR